MRKGREKARGGETKMDRLGSQGNGGRGGECSEASFASFFLYMPVN